MKRIILVMAAISAVGGSLWAQESASTSNENYVLQQARDKYTSTSQPASSPEPAAATAQPGTTIINIEVTQVAAPDKKERRSSYDYTPFVLSLVPGVSLPFGIYDCSLSAASIGALTGSVYGAQIAGLFNIADGDVRGFQSAGIFNIADGDVCCVQTAGIFNISGSVKGFQGAGIFNIADRMDGFQGAGIFNIADEMQGVQIAGVLNVAGKAKGTMIGLINVADELDGVAIGLVNILGNGIHDIAVDYQFDSGRSYVTYRSGTPFLYAAFSAGQNWNDFLRNTRGLTLGTAIGHRVRFLFLTADLELGVETPVDPLALDRIYRELVSINLRNFDPRRFAALAASFETFGTLRASFGFGNRKGFGPYLGIKADFAPSAGDTVPLSMRSAFGTSVPYVLPLGDLSLNIWPKWFVGIKF